MKGAHLLDTCVLSELARPRPDAGVLAWLEAADESALYLSVLTLGELEKGIARLPTSARRRKIEQWVRQDLAARFEGRLLEVEKDLAPRAAMPDVGPLFAPPVARAPRWHWPGLWY